MKDLIEILTWCRGAGTQSEALFVKKFIQTIPNSWTDDYGNVHLTIGKDPTILWSCHTDTVTRKEGMQNVKWIGKGLLGLNNAQQGQCLGADNGAGLWIMLELIKAEKPGHYVFHRDEEIGGIGSSFIAKNQYLIPDSIMAAIAMDRCGRQDIITHQGFSRCCSDDFAKSLQAQLPMGMMPDDTGVFTDTANYVDFVGECTNLAVGYERNHGPSETLDVYHVRRLRDSLVALDIDKLVFKREPGEVEYSDYGSMYGHGGYHTFGSSTSPNTHGGTELWENDPAIQDWLKRRDAEDNGEESAPFGERSITLEEMVSEAPDVAARLISELGVTDDEFRAHVFALKGRLLGA
jgi:hypothetical protein